LAHFLPPTRRKLGLAGGGGGGGDFAAKGSRDLRSNS